MPMKTLYNMMEMPNFRLLFHIVHAEHVRDLTSI